MPVRTITQELCDVCFAADQTTETPVTDRLRFSWQGRPHVLLVCDTHVSAIRDSLQHWSEIASEPGGGSSRARRGGGGGSSNPTLFSQLDSEEKDRFRKWADMPTARRIGDARVQQWIEAGRP